jgi:hypothetical protein
MVGTSPTMFDAMVKIAFSVAWRQDLRRISGDLGRKREYFDDFG